MSYSPLANLLAERDNAPFPARAGAALAEYSSGGTARCVRCSIGRI